MQRYEIDIAETAFCEIVPGLAKKKANLEDEVTSLRIQVYMYVHIWHMKLRLPICDLCIRSTKQAEFFTLGFYNPAPRSFEHTFVYSAQLCVIHVHHQKVIKNWFENHSFDEYRGKGDSLPEARGSTRIFEFLWLSGNADKHDLMHETLLQVGSHEPLFAEQARWSFVPSVTNQAMLAWLVVTWDTIAIWAPTSHFVKLFGLSKTLSDVFQLRKS